MGKDEQLTVNLLIRADVQGSVEALRERGFSEDPLPSPSTLAEVLNRLG